MTTGKQVERALAEIVKAIASDTAHPQHPGIHPHLTAAYTQLTAVATLLAPQ